MTTDPATAPLTVDVFADIACPFCYIGLERLTKLAAERPLQVTWRPFQLQPDLPREGVDWAVFRAQKFGGDAGAQAAFDHVTQYACTDDVCFNWDAIGKAANTRDAHRVILLAQDRGVGVAAAMRLMRAHFEEGADVGSADVLARLAVEVGVDEADVRTVLAGNAYGAEVDASQGLAARSGVQGVPFYVLRAQYALSGAQPLDTMRGALAWAAAQPLSPA
ncbi:DsbA family oxidoreductase [Deinococcus maricopensis]|nr:DsbA family oxidoreductase [Deinococcus maricopensis]